MFSKLIEAAQSNVFGRPFVASCQGDETAKQIVPSRPTMAAAGKIFFRYPHGQS